VEDGMSVTLWTKFYWSNWLGDAKLRSCSIGARGLWMDMLAIAAQNDPVGYIVVRHGTLTTLLSRVAGIPEEQAEAYFSELFDAGVIHLDEHGRMFDPRMIRDNENLQKAITSGRRGGRKSRDRKKGIFKPSEGASG
jgi:hypothetical protein